MTTPAPNDDLVRALKEADAQWQRRCDQWEREIKQSDPDTDYSAAFATMRVTRDGRAAAALEAQAERISVLERALEPSAETKAAYSGEFFERLEISNPNFDEDDENEPETLVQQVPVSWTTIKEIMAAIRSQATLTGAR